MITGEEEDVQRKHNGAEHSKTIWWDIAWEKAEHTAMDRPLWRLGVKLLPNYRRRRNWL